MRLAVYPDGAVVLTAPTRSSEQTIERFFAQHAPWVEKHRRRFSDRIVLRIRRGDIPRFKREALALAVKYCAHYAERYGYTYKKITIRAQKRRWGSCSKAGNLSFNYKIAALPDSLMRYVVVHEVCHLGAFDHSKKFWDLVAREVPEHNALRAELRRVAAVFE